MPPYGGRVSGWVTSPFCRGVASSEMELIRSPEGRSATLERGGGAVRYRGFRGGESTREVRGVGSTVVITVPSTSGLSAAGSHSVTTAPGMVEQCPELADGSPVTATVRSSGLRLSNPGVAVELLAFNASIQRAGEQMGH